MDVFDLFSSNRGSGNNSNLTDSLMSGSTSNIFEMIYMRLSELRDIIITDDEAAETAHFDAMCDDGVKNSRKCNGKYRPKNRNLEVF